MTFRFKFGLIMSCVLTATGLAQSESFTLTPTQDGFTREQAPTINLGGGGAIHVAGSAALNVTDEAQGVADAFIMFNAADAVAFFNAQFGDLNWDLTGVTLTLNEVGAPNNGIFSRGVGTFDILYVANDDWSEGPGRPSTQVEAESNQLSFTSGRALLNELADANLGSASNSGMDSASTYELDVAFELAVDVANGGDITLYLVATDVNTGATFRSANRADEAEHPMLTLTAEALVDDLPGDMDDGMGGDDMMMDDMGDGMMDDGMGDDDDGDDGAGDDMMDDPMDDQGDDMMDDPTPDPMMPIMCGPMMGMGLVTLSLGLASLKLSSQRRRRLRK